MMAAAFLMVAGALCVAFFVHLVLNVQPRWFPGEVAARDGFVPDDGRPRMSHLGFGLVVATLFFVGVALFSLGSAIIATTLGYGR